MKKYLFLALSGLLAMNMAVAQTAAECEAKAVSKEGKPLAGAAKNAFMKKCQAEAKDAAKASCEAKAVDKNGKALAGAAKASFMKKCEADSVTSGQ